MNSIVRKKSFHRPAGGGRNQRKSAASTKANRTATVIIGGSASTATLAKMLFTPQISAIDISCRKSSGAKAREGVVTPERYACPRKGASRRFCATSGDDSAAAKR